MKLGYRYSTQEPLEILAKKTDQEGRSIYQVKWNNTEENIIQWIPLRNLTQYQKIINQYDSKLSKPNKQWNINLHALQSHREKQRKSNQISFFMNSTAEDNNNQKALKQSYSIQNQNFNFMKYKIYKDKKKWLRKQYRDIPFTTGLDPQQLISLKRKKKKVYKRQNGFKVKQIHKKYQQEVYQQQFDDDLKMVKTIYISDNKWFVDLIKNNDQVISMQKYKVRLNHPKLLLSYYQDVYKIQKEII